MRQPAPASRAGSWRHSRLSGNAAFESYPGEGRRAGLSKAEERAALRTSKAVPLHTGITPLSNKAEAENARDNQKDRDNVIQELRHDYMRIPAINDTIG